MLLWIQWNSTTIALFCWPAKSGFPKDFPRKRVGHILNIKVCCHLIQFSVVLFTLQSACTRITSHIAHTPHCPLRIRPVVIISVNCFRSPPPAVARTPSFRARRKGNLFVLSWPATTRANWVQGSGYKWLSWATWLGLSVRQQNKWRSPKAAEKLFICCPRLAQELEEIGASATVLPVRIDGWIVGSLKVVRRLYWQHIRAHCLQLRCVFV